MTTLQVGFQKDSIQRNTTILEKISSQSTSCCFSLTLVHLFLYCINKLVYNDQMTYLDQNSVWSSHTLVCSQKVNIIYAHQCQCRNVIKFYFIWEKGEKESPSHFIFTLGYTKIPSCKKEGPTFYDHFTDPGVLCQTGYIIVVLSECVCVCGGCGELGIAACSSSRLFSSQIVIRLLIN